MFPKLHSFIYLFFTFFISATSFAGTNPFLSASDGTVVCASDGSMLAELFLCNSGETRLVQVIDPTVQSVIWQLLDSGSCPPADEDCPNLNVTCNWNTVSTSNSFVIDAQGEYRVKLTYSSAPSETFYAKSFQSSYSDFVMVTKSITGNGATDGEITITASGEAPFLHQLSNDGGNTYGSLQSSPVFANLSTGDYQIRTYDNSGVCEYFSTPVVLTEPANLTSNVVLTQQLTCISQAEIQIEVTGGVAPYEFSLNGVAFFPMVANTSIVSGLSAGTYDISVRDTNGYGVSSLLTIEPIEPITVTATGTDIACFGELNGYIVATAQGGSGDYSFMLTDGNGTIIQPMQNSGTFANLSTGLYQLEVHDALSCTGISSQIVISEPEYLQVERTIQNASYNGANDGRISLNAMGGVAPYSYSINSSPYLPFVSEITDLAPGQYIIAIRDVHGCTRSMINTITEPVALSASIVTFPVVCGQTTESRVEVTASGASGSFMYALDSTDLIDGQGSNIFLDVSTGTHYITVFDASGYVRTIDFEMEAPTSPIFSTYHLNSIACSINDPGRLDVYSTGGQAPYQYVLKDDHGTIIAGPQAESTFEGFSGGFYEVTVSDVLGCESSFEFSIIAAESMTLDYEIQDESTANANDASIEIIITNGRGEKEYALSTNPGVYQTSNRFENLTAGEYVIFGRDENRCITATSVLVEVKSAPFTVLPQNIEGLRSGELTCTDFDSDGDLDILTFGNDIQANAHSLLYNNDQLAFSETELINFPTLFEGTMNWSDYNNNGQMDLAVIGDSMEDATVISKILEYNGDFADTNIVLPGVSRGAIEWADYDNDGLKDVLIVGQNAQSQSITKLFQNRDSLFVEVNMPNVTGVSFGDAAWADYNSDGLYDFIITGVTGTAPNTGAPVTQLYKNTGAGFLLDENSSFVGVSESSIDWGDADNDGDLDVLITGFTANYNAFTGLYINDGGSFTLLETALPNVIEGFAKWGDYDNDGDLDVLIAGNNIGLFGKLCMVYSNDGLEFSSVFEGIGVGQASGQWADFNNDGFLDIIVNGQQNDFDLSALIYMNSGKHTDVNDKTSYVSNISGPAIPTNIGSEIDDNNVKLTWNVSIDDKTDSKSLHYAVRLLKDGAIYIPSLSNDSGALQLVEPGNAGLNNFYLAKNLEPGDYEWSVQAIDNAYGASSFSRSETFTIAETSVEEKDEEISKVIVYQNQGHTEVINLLWQMLRPSETTIAVYNSKGTLVFVSETSQGTLETQIDVANLSRGIYFVYIKNAEIEEVKKVLIR